jgi:hypothetical protein
MNQVEAISVKYEIKFNLPMNTQPSDMKARGDLEFDNDKD